jgi:Ca2+-binding EF-hand superfamily protein
MVGAVIDNNVFDKLVKQFMPVLGDHFAKYEIQLSVAALPWFLTLFVNSLPLPFALRVLDCFFMEGVKVLFQVGLAILKVNGDAILKATDDGELMYSFINQRRILKSYFSKLGDTLVVEQAGRASRQTTIFNQLMLTAYKEFQNVTTELIVSLRKSIQLEVIQSMDLYSKKSLIRKLNKTYSFTKEELLFLCDCYYTFLYYRQGPRINSKINLQDFYELICQLCDWARDNVEGDVIRDFPTAENSGLRFMKMLFDRIFDTNSDGYLDFENVITGLSKIVHTPNSCQLFFDIHDSDQDGYLSKEDLINLSETLLFLFRKIQLHSDSPLGAVSSLLNRCFSVKDMAEGYKLDFNTFKELLAQDNFLVEYFATFPGTFILTDVKSGVVTNTTKAVQVQEIAESIFSGGLKWAASKIATKSRIQEGSEKPTTNNAELKPPSKANEEEGFMSEDEFHDANDGEDDILQEVEEMLQNSELESTQNINNSLPGETKQ